MRLKINLLQFSALSVIFAVFLTSCSEPERPIFQQTPSTGPSGSLNQQNQRDPSTGLNNPERRANPPSNGNRHQAEAQAPAPDGSFPRRGYLRIEGLSCQCLRRGNPILLQNQYRRPIQVHIRVKKNINGQVTEYHPSQEKADTACRNRIQKLNEGGGESGYTLSGPPHFNPPIPLRDVSSERLNQCMSAVAMD